MSTDAPSAPTGQLVCVFGVSGVGKTSLIAAYCETHPSWQSLNAGELLMRRRGIGLPLLRIAPKPQIEDYQQQLVHIIRGIRAASPAQNWLLDAHSIIDCGGEYFEVSVSHIQALAPSALLFIHSDPTAIAARRAATPDKRIVRSPAEIEAEQALAYAACLRYSTSLKQMLRRVVAGDAAAFTEALRQIS
jgi:adenylate kinase